MIFSEVVNLGVGLTLAPKALVARSSADRSRFEIRCTVRRKRSTSFPSRQRFCPFGHQATATPATCPRVNIGKAMTAPVIFNLPANQSGNLPADIASVALGRTIGLPFQNVCAGSDSTLSISH